MNTSNSAAPASDTINVMLVDDSAVIRGALTKLLEDEPRIKIAASVPNGELAVKSAAAHKPDIVILDIEMPVMDGIEALPLILEKSPNSKVIMFSTLTEKGANITLKALSLGAVECLVKPASGEARKGGAFQTQLLNIVRNLADPAHCKTEQNSQTKTPAPSSAASPSSYSLRKNPHDYKGRPNILAIGSSTGGPQALFEVLSHCKNLNMPIVLTQHMPATFTKILAKHITQHTGLACDEGEEGMPLENNKVIVAPGGLHMILRQDDNNSVVVHLDDGPMVNFCKPAVDPMFESLLPIYGRKILAVILTGMGNDGLKASQKLAEAGCPLIAQDEKTSIVWGMPGAVAKAGICTAVLPIDQIGPSIQKAANG